MVRTREPRSGEAMETESKGDARTRATTYVLVTLGWTAVAASGLDDPRTDRTGRRSPLLAADVQDVGDGRRATRYLMSLERAREVRAWIADCPAAWLGNPGPEAARERAAIRRTLAVLDRAIAQGVRP